MVETLYPLPPTNPLPSESPEAWFHAIEAPPEKPKKPWKLIAIIVSVVTFLAAISLLIITLLPSTCLNATDYKSLTNITADGSIAPKDNFYTYTIYFAPGSGTYDITAEQTAQHIIETIGTFYQSHSNKSILFTIDSNYILTSDSTLAEQRIASIKSDLVATGIPESAIIVAAPTQIDTESETDIAKTATIAITSAGTCK